jgi:hypothetical protein
MKEIIPFSWKSETQTNLKKKKKKQKKPAAWIFKWKELGDAVRGVRLTGADVYRKCRESESRERDVNPDERQLKHFTEPNKIRRAWTIEPNRRERTRGTYFIPHFPKHRTKKKKTHKISNVFFSFLNRLFPLKWVVSRKRIEMVVEGWTVKSVAAFNSFVCI